MASVWGELKRRNVVRVGVGYAIVAWLLLQVADVTLNNIEAPAWVFQTILLLLIIGLPLALFFAWAFELTPDGLKKEKDVDRSKSITDATGRKLDFIIIGVLAAALLMFALDKFVWTTDVASDVTASSESRAIAVLPFDNRSAEEENAAFFADGIRDELLTRLSNIGDLKIISLDDPDMVRYPRQIAAEFGVGSILEGDLQRAGDTVRINIRLINAETGEQIWAKAYSGKLNTADIFATQAEISTSIANALQAKLSPDEQRRIAAVPTESMEALEAYFSGQLTMSRRSEQSVMTAIEYFERAIKLDPDFAGAWSGLAEAWMRLPDSSLTTDLVQVRSESASAVEKAIDLDPDSPYALAVSGWHDLLYEFDWQGAEQSFLRALQIEPTNPNALHWYSHLHSSQGNHAEAIALAESRIEADPLALILQTHLAAMYANARRWDESFAVGEAILSQELHTATMGALWRHKISAGRTAEGATMFVEWAAATGRNAEAAERIANDFIQFQQTGEPVTPSEELLVQLQLGNTQLIWVYGFVGDKEKTIELLQRQYRQRAASQFLLNIKVYAFFDFIRDDPRFVELLDQIGLAD